jgi:hypothetical protein
MKQVNARAKRPRNYRKLLLATKSERSSNLRTKLGSLAEPGSTAFEDLAAVFYNQFVALRINRLDYVQLKLKH